MSIYGINRHFVAHLDDRTCQHCGNRVVMQAYAIYDYQVHFFVKFENFHEVQIICHICEHGHSINFYDITRSSRGMIGPADWEQRKNRAIEGKAFIEKNSKIAATAQYYNSLSPSQKSFYQKMLSKLGLKELLMNIVGANR